MSSDIELTDTMGQGANVTTMLDLPLVGNIMSLKLKLSSNDFFMCDKLNVSLTYKTWEFPCQEPYNNSGKDGYNLLPTSKTP